ncbi:bacteriophage Mu Gp45 protein [Paramagnetospirillum caucaseum]|uniref:Bacteriophage Mu Gp45 protein n=1 Tax=Paramagnetospirillum caucaseum TaxID=1244869 RepID=M2Z5W9_9PROT|nr:phage baseplate assembly protein [Paramagnetospirillum caucaseum]EME69710.1 bacteriophage Mu Gp45 protein [Paramagnetospirillum caucaseum]
MVRRLIAAALQPLRDRLAMMVGRGVLAALEADGGLMRAGIKGIDDEVLGERDYVLDYGISTRPHPGAEALMLFLAGLRSNGVVVRLYDRRYTISLEYGEVAIHDDKGQKVHLTRTGIAVTSPLDITVASAKTLRLAGERVHIHATKYLDVDCNGHGWCWASLGASYTVTNYVIGEVSSATVAVSPAEVPHGD